MAGSPMTGALGPATAAGVHRGRGAPAPVVARPRWELWRLVAAGAVGAGALGLPWAGLELSPGLSAWTLPLSLAVVPLVGHLTYGAPVSLLLLGALFSAWRGGWARTAAVRWCGLALVIAPVVFVVTTRIAGSELLFRLGQSSDEISFLARNGATISQGSPTTTFLGLSSDATTVLLLRSLRLGWYLCAAAGALMVGTRGLPRPPAVPALGALAGALVVTTGIVCGLVGQADKLDGVEALAAGRPALALADIQRALSLSPQLAYDTAVPQTVGEADLELGRQSADAYFAEATAQPAVNQPAVLRDVALLAKASSLAPANAVIASQYDQLLANGVAQSGPLVFHYAAQRPASLIVAWTTGLKLYHLGDNGLTIEYMDRVLGDTTSAEMRSYALTYIAFAEDRLGQVAAFRDDVVQAVKDDTDNVNVLAREAAAGLFLPSWA